MLFYRMMKPLVRLYLRLYHRIEVKGVENIPQKGRVIVVGNHVSYLDPFYIGASIPRFIHFMAKVEAFQNPVLRWFLQRFGAFPVDRSKADVQAIKTALHYLEQEQVVGLFPEGGIREEELQSVKQGAAYLSYRTQSPIIPVYIEGTYDALPEGKWWIRPAKIRMKFGEAIIPAAYFGRKKNVMEKMSKDILEQLKSLRTEILEKEIS